MRVVDIILQGALLGGLYALYAAGLSLIFGVMRLVNLAHGDLIVLSAFVLFALSAVVGLPVHIALITALPFLFGLGYGLHRCLFARVLGPDVLPPLLVSFGLSILIQNGLLQVFSADSHTLSGGTLATASLAILPDLSIGVMPLLNFAVAVGTIWILNRLFHGTALGRSLRASADNADIVQLMGVDPRRMFSVAMGLSLAVAGLAALFMGLRANFDPSIGPARLLYAFEAVVIGGLGSLWGTLAGGVVLALAQTVGGALDPEWQILAGHLGFLAVVLLRPRGLFPKAGA
ncbi:branched-chain amino acid ABC transporter permease [Methylobacterium oxalidis]|uniref:branched-chain amino acid ABC transporter permease n=1 Tax=Methylobacterium oxalidis TaxID=944322 RepID=UPI0033158BA2